MSHTSLHLWYTLVVFGAAMLAVGCGQSGPAVYPVKGVVVYPDGSPVSGGSVEFEALEGEWKGHNARGAIQDDGSFTLTTEKQGDGAVAGRQRAIVRGPYPSRMNAIDGKSLPRRLVHTKYSNYDTSGLEFTIVEGKNELTIEVISSDDRAR